MDKYVVFGQRFRKDGPFGWELIGIFSADNIDHAVEQAKNAEPYMTKFFAGRGLFREVDNTPQRIV